MTNDSPNIRVIRPRPTAKTTARLRGLAEAGARGKVLSTIEIRELCEAIRSQQHVVRNQFHSS